MDCWKCGAATGIVTRFSGNVSPYELRHRLELCDSLPRLAERIQRAIRHRRDIGPVRERYSRTAGYSYVSNGCAHCGVLIGRFYELNAWDRENETVAEIALPVDAGGHDTIMEDPPRWGVWEVASLRC